jgi:hypothetical protein
MIKPYADAQKVAPEEEKEADGLYTQKRLRPKKDLPPLLMKLR